MKIYHYLLKFVSLFRKRGLHHSVNAEQPANTVFAQIRNIFDSAKRKFLEKLLSYLPVPTNTYSTVPYLPLPLQVLI